MRIIVNNVAASSGGALSILRSFYNYLVNSEVGKKHEWIFLLSGNYIQETENIKVIVLEDIKKRWVNRLKFDLFSGKNFISKLNPDIVFSLQNTITFGLKYDQVLYMHQSIPFQKTKKFSFYKSGERKLAIYQYLIGTLIKESIKRANKTFVQTEWIKKSIIESTKVSPDRIQKVFPPSDDVIKYKKDNLFQNNSFFYPAEDSIYKNHKCIYDAIDILYKKEIINFQVSLTIEGKNKKDTSISYLGRIPLESVMEKYNTSTLLFPSYIETVGLPLIEARNMGTIILAADCPFSREALVGYGNAYFFDPFNPNQLSVLMEKVITGQITKLVQKDLKNDPQSSWNYVIDTIESISGEKN